MVWPTSPLRVDAFPSARARYATLMTDSPQPDSRVPICYLAPWVDYGGSDKGTIDWFRWIDRDRFVPSLVTTQPSPNRRLAEIYPFADEVWALPTFLAGQHF